MWSGKGWRCTCTLTHGYGVGGWGVWVIELIIYHGGEGERVLSQPENLITSFSLIITR